MAIRIPQNRIQYKYTSGKELMYEKTYQEYQGYYYELNGKLFPGKEFNSNAPTLIKINSDKVNSLLTNSSTYTYGKVSGIKIPNNKITSIPSLSAPDNNSVSEVFNSGIGSRNILLNYNTQDKELYFYCTKKNQPSLIKEINEDTYLSLQNNPLYTTTYVGTYKNKTQTVDDIEKQMPGITDFLTSEVSPTTTTPTPLSTTYKPLSVSLPSTIVSFGFESYTLSPTLYTLTMEFDSAVWPVINETDISDWNTFFGLTGGKTFLTANISSNTVTLTTKDTFDLADYRFASNTDLISINDTGCITAAGDNCFYDCSFLTSVSFPLLTTAGSNCFYNCTSLTSISLPSLTAIGGGGSCFAACSSLTSISLPLYSQNNLPPYSFAGCSSLTSISILLLNNVEDYCFSGCGSLTSVNFPALDSIGNYGFSQCVSLTSISFPLLTSVSANVFDTCTSLTNIYLPLCTNLGGTPGDDTVFDNITGKTINATFNSYLQTNYNVPSPNSPDGDIQYLTSNNTVTITWV